MLTTQRGGHLIAKKIRENMKYLYGSVEFKTCEDRQYEYFGELEKTGYKT